MNHKEVNIDGKNIANNPRLYEAMQLTFELFGHDSRKSTSVPVMAHLLSVCGLVQNDGGDEDEAIAALLHDTLEDKPDKITRDEILERFGPRVLEIVEISTDTPVDYRGGPKPPWKGENNSISIGSAEPTRNCCG